MTQENDTNNEDRLEKEALITFIICMAILFMIIIGVCVLTYYSEAFRILIILIIVIGGGYLCIRALGGGGPIFEKHEPRGRDF